MVSISYHRLLNLYSSFPFTDVRLFTSVPLFTPVLCRDIAQDLYSLKPELDRLGVALIGICHEWLPAEIAAFSAYWPGDVYLDTTKTLFKAVGGGKIHKENLWNYLNPRSKVWPRIFSARKRVAEHNMIGNGLTMGGLMVMRQGNGGIEYLFLEEDFGDSAGNKNVLKAAEGAASAMQLVVASILNVAGK
jgi:hypothetical protein